MKDTVFYISCMVVSVCVLTFTIMGIADVVFTTRLARANKACAFAGYSGAVADYQYHPIYCYDEE